MRIQYKYSIIIALVVFLISVVIIVLNNHNIVIQQYRSLSQLPRIYPDYYCTVIPPNIAPMNFVIKEKAEQYYAKIFSKHGKPIEIFSRSPKISIPQESWHELLDLNHGQELLFDIYMKTDSNGWNRFQTITNNIANENIDGFLAYRKIHPSQNSWREMGLFQRNMQTFEETPILKNNEYQRGCVHCHSFWKNRTDKISIAIRKGGEYPNSQLIVNGDQVRKIENVLGFTSWHPSGRLLAASINTPRLILHTARNEMRDIVDLKSWIGYFFLDSGEIKTIPQLSKKDQLENYPTWSPDGRYLYFTSTKMLWTDLNTVPPENYDKVKYSLYRISYDIEQDKWGETEPVLLSENTGLSLNQPRISPDGRWLTFSMCDYSCWPSYHPESDLYIVDLIRARETGRYEYRKMEINSDQCESWHSWSSNSRWIVFSSKKGHPLFNRSYIAYIDENGKLSKAFVLPQEDPTFYDTYLKTFTIPELVTEPIKATGEKLAGVIRNSENVLLKMPITIAVTPKIDQSKAVQ
jgi:hypothetical protein